MDFMKWLVAAVNSLKNFWDVGQAVVVVLVVLLFVLGKLPGARLIRRTLFQGQILGPFRALRELIACVWTLLEVAPTHLVRPRSLRRAVRVWIEMAILDPRPGFEWPEGKPWQKKWREAFGEHRGVVKEWKERREAALRRLIHGDHAVVIPVATCFEVHDKKKPIAAYFETLMKDRADDAEHFISMLEIKTAYLAPLHLVAGLLPNFGEDWVPVINDFGRALTRPGDPLRDTSLRSVQAFIFDCWLVWGPSIPLCKCKRFRGIEALQLGYGDENNSIPLVSDLSIPLVENAPEPVLFKRFEALLADGAGAATGARPLALQVTVVGRPAWVRRDQPGVPPAMRGIVDKLVLEHRGMKYFGGDTEDDARLYYSAYLWIIFVIQHPDGQPLFPQTEATHKGEIWRGLLTFFEHGNIADGVAYDFMKEQLARKALAGLARLAEDSQAAGWRFAYACAFDDPGCGEGGGDTRRFPEPVSSVTLRQRLERRLRSDEFATLAKSGRVSVTPNTNPVYSACHLTDMVQDFYKVVDPARATADAHT